MKKKRKTSNSSPVGRPPAEPERSGVAPAAAQEKPSLPRSGDHLRYEHVEFDRFSGDVDLKRCVFIDVGFKEAQFRGRVTHSRFERCYLRKAEFRGVDLTGTTFVKCNLDHASLNSCKLDYVAIEDCDVDYQTFLQNLPPQPNLRRRLLRSLRLNAAQRRDVEERDLLLAELAAEKEELFATFVGSNEYFQKKPGIVRFKAFGSWIAHQFQKLLWGYGLRVRSLVIAAMAFVLLSAVMVWACEFLFNVNGVSRELSFSEALLLALASFSTVGLEGTRAESVGSSLFVVSQGVAGASFLGLFAATVYRKIAR